MEEVKSFVLANIKPWFLENIIKEYELPIDFKIDHKNKKFFLPVILCYKKESNNSKLYFTHIKIKDKEIVDLSNINNIIYRELLALGGDYGLETSSAFQSIIDIILEQLDKHKIEYSI